jgi:hypothetical protein
VTAGNKWSDGSFDPNKIPDSLAALTRMDVVPIGGYYFVPPFPTDFYCYYSQGIFTVYNYCDTGPRYIEMIEFYPVEYYMPGSPVGAVAYWFRYGGLPEVVYNPDLGRVVTVTRQVPATLQYPARVVDNIIEVKTVQYGRTLAQILTNTATLADSGNLLILGPMLDYHLFTEERCGGSGSCSKSFYIPADQSYRIVRVDYSVSVSCARWSAPWLTYAESSINLDGPWGTYTSSGSESLIGFWSTGTQISFRASGRCVYVHPSYSWATTSQPGDVTATVKVVLMKVSEATAIRTGNIPFAVSTVRNTATATFAGSINIRDQIKRAVVNETLSGEMYAHLAGTVQGGQIIKVKAPIVLLNYVYGIAGSPPGPPSRGGGGGGEVGSVRLVCTVDESAQLSSSGTGSADSGSGSPSPSPSTPTPQPAYTISGSRSPDYYFLNQQVEVLRRGVCRPI